MKLTQKEAAIERLNSLETEAQKLREIIEEPDVRKPEAGDLWLTESGNEWFITEHTATILVSKVGHWDSGQVLSGKYEASPSWKTHEHTYLGKHSEVYVKISDVRDALSHRDSDGDSVMSFLNGYIAPYSEGSDKTAEALRKLNIIKD